MNKKSQNNLSTSRILKSKYNQKEKQKTIPLVNRMNQKVKLLDLCPEEKLKIGELIKTLETRKEQNEYLTQQFYQLTQKFKETEDMLQKNIVLLHQKQKREVELLEKIQKYKEKLRIKQQIIMTLEIQNKKNRPNLQTNYTKVQYSVQTEGKKQMFQVSIQTKNKKNKQKNQSVQVNTHEATQSVFFRPHSKSFQKIMKSSLPFDNIASKELNKILTTQRITKKKCSSSGFERQSSPNIHDFQSSSDSAQLLAQKWRQLKQKHQNINPMCSSFGIKQLPRQKFNDSGSDEQVKVRIIPNILKKIEEYDELELNKMLKSKKFSAKKLIQWREQSNYKNAKERMSPQVNYLKSPCFNNQNESQNKKPTPSDPDINFFESDMLEIADSINV